MGDHIDIPETDAALLAQCDVTTFRATGPGGQGVNTTDSAVRLRHRPSGITVVARRERSQYLNKKAALERLRRKLEEQAYEAPERVPTRKSRAAKERVLRAKHVQARRKVTRRKVDTAEE
ncbi:MAG: peptide chain release factor-like protein [Coriobacteriia bacterium]